MSEQKTWIQEAPTKGSDFIGGVGAGTFATLELKASSGASVVEWIGTKFNLNFDSENDNFETAIDFQICFILTEIYDTTNKTELEKAFLNKLPKLFNLFSDSKNLMPVESIKQINQANRLLHWIHHRKTYSSIEDLIGINRKTVIDYLLLQSLGLKDFALYISNEDGVKLHTVRDRLAYARRMGWLKKPGVGIRTSYMKKEK
jgi:hypothetical protein